jgi:hypothetical protein
MRQFFLVYYTQNQSEPSQMSLRWRVATHGYLPNYRFGGPPARLFPHPLSSCRFCVKRLWNMCLEHVCISSEGHWPLCAFACRDLSSNPLQLLTASTFRGLNKLEKLWAIRCVFFPQQNAYVRIVVHLSICLCADISPIPRWKVQSFMD